MLLCEPLEKEISKEEAIGKEISKEEAIEKEVSKEQVIEKEEAIGIRGKHRRSYRV